MFDLSDDQNEKLEIWMKDQDDKALKIQIERGFLSEQWKKPYYGCSGGAYTYSFTPTTLGTIVKVINNVTKEEINLTNFDEW